MLTSRHSDLCDALSAEQCSCNDEISNVVKLKEKCERLISQEMEMVSILKEILILKVLFNVSDTFAKRIEEAISKAEGK